jgi:hypothetical protein
MISLYTRALQHIEVMVLLLQSEFLMMYKCKLTIHKSRVSRESSQEYTEALEGQLSSQRFFKKPKFNFAKYRTVQFSSVTQHITHSRLE